MEGDGQDSGWRGSEQGGPCGHQASGLRWKPLESIEEKTGPV